MPERVCEERLKEDTGSLRRPGRPSFAWPQQAGFPPGHPRPRLAGFLFPPGRWPLR